MGIFKIFYVLFAISLFFGCGSNSNDNEIVQAKKPQISDEEILEMARSYWKPLPEIPKDIHPEIKSRVALGKKLFYDKRLSNNETISCNTCHDLNNFGVDNKPVSPGDSGENGTRNSPTVLNASLQFAQFWDARGKDVEEQAQGPIFGEVEMEMESEEKLIGRLSKNAEYLKMFTEAFPEEERLITLENITKAIGAFERTLITPSKFDDFLKGDINALNKSEKRGIHAFVGAGCIPCHSGELVGGNMSQKFAIFGYYWDYTGSDILDKGRYNFTKNLSDKFVFKVPTLRNIEKTYPYFHDGSIEDLGDAVKIMAKAETNIDLSEQDVQDIVAFLKTLTGKVPKDALQ